VTAKISTTTPCRHGANREECLACLRQHQSFLQEKVKKQQAEIARLEALVKTLADRVAAQSEQLVRMRAEKRG
jgi:hypothetical protein